METVLCAVQLVKGTMSSDTPRGGRSTTPKYQKHSSRSPVRASSRKRDSGVEAQAAKDIILAPKRQ